MKPKRRIRWKRGCEGYVDSHCGRWHIAPEYFGTARPQGYALYMTGERGRPFGSYDTVAVTKECAEDALLRVEKEAKP